MSDYFFYDMNKKMADLAKKQQLAEDAQSAPAKPAPNRLMEAAADYSAKKAAAGKDIGKPGKNFSKIAAGAAKKYGSAEAGKRVAGAVLNKLRHPTKEGVEPPKHYGPPGQIPSVETAKFDRYMQQRWAEHEATRPQPIKPPGLPTKEGVNQSQLKPYKSTMKEGGKPDFLDLDKDGNRKEPMKSAARSAKKVVDEGVSNIKQKIIKLYKKGLSDDEIASRLKIDSDDVKSVLDDYEWVADTTGKGIRKTAREGNAFSGAVVKAKRDGIQPGEKITVGGKTYPVREDNDMKEYLARYSPDTLERIKNASDDQLYSMAQGFGGDQHSRVDRELDQLYKARRDLSGPEGADARRVKGVQDRFDKVMRRKSEKSNNRTMDEAYVRHLDIRGDRGGDEADAEEYSNEYQLYNPHISDKKRNSELTTKGFSRAQDVGDRLGDVMRHNKEKSAYGKTMGGRIKSALGLDEVDATPQHVDDWTPPPKPAPKASAPRPPVAPKPAPKKPAMYPPQVIDDPVKEGGVPMTPKQKKFAALAKPFDKITFADKIVGAKKEVDEMLGDVAADAMKKAVGSRGQSSYQRGQQQDDEFASDHFARARNQRRHDAEDEWARSKGRKPHADMDESFLDDEPTSRRSSTGGRIDTSEPGVTRHRAVKGNYSGAGHDAGADDEPSGAVGRRKVGAGMGKKIGAKINRGTSKLMTKEGDMPEDMIEPQDSGEYDREGEMAKDDIKTVVRHAQALEKILGDEDNLPEWVQSKLAKIEGMMTAVDDYMQNQNDDDSGDDMEMDEERTSKRDNRAERAGRKVAKDIEYDEKRKDGIHGKRRGSEDDKAERAGKKVTKDIEYDEKKKEVDETTTSGSVATGAAAPKSGGHSYGKGIYDSLNRQLENMISESMNINMSMNNDDHGGPRQSLTVTATDEDAVMLAGLLKMAGLGHGDEHIHAMTGDDSDMDALHNIDHMHGDEPCEECGSTECECDGMMENIATNPDGTPYVTDIDPDQHDAETARLGRAGQAPSFRTPGAASAGQGGYNEIEEAYGDTDASENEPDWPTDEEGTDDAMMYSGGLNGPKSTGQTTTPIIAHQNDRMGSDGDHELRRMMEIAGLR